MVTGRRWIVLALLSTGCLEVGGFEWHVDVPTHTARLTLTGLTSSSETDTVGDLRTLVDDYVNGENLAKRFPHAKFGPRTLRVDGDQLVLDVTIDWTFAQDLGWRDWDAARPYRFCPESDYHVEAANADFRDSEGCVVWDAGRTALDVTSANSPHDRVSLVPAFTAWEAAGRPTAQPL